MAIPLLPILGTLSSLAGTAWDTYSKVKRARDSALASKAEKESREALIHRLENLEELCFDQARLVSELSKDLDQFAQALQAQLEAAQKRQARLKVLLYGSFLVAAAGLTLSLILYFR
jgi:predicted transcriptional regulator